MAKYIVSAQVTIGVSTAVEADSAEEAKKIASERSVIGLCYQCANSDTEDEEWVTSGHLDGEPMNLTAEEK